MAHVKASDLVILRRLLEEHGDAKARVLSALDGESARLLQTTSATAWVPLATEAAVFQASASALYPGDDRGLVRLGREVARRQFTGMYKVFLNVATVAFIVKRAGTIFRTFYDAGDSRIEDFHDEAGTLVVTGLPDLHEAQRAYIEGFLTGLVELAGAKDVAVRRGPDAAGEWRWRVTWRREGGKT